MNLELFEKELKKLNITLSKEQKNQLEKYYEMLVEYNKVMNLTGITEKEEVYLKHFYDSITIARVINLEEQENLCDIGTGAGFPGLVLKIVYPHLKVTLVDSLNKRLEFLKIVIKELKLEEVVTAHARAEKYGITNREIYDVVTARAVASTSVLLEYSASLIKLGKYFIAMKGKLLPEEKFDTAQKELNLELISEEKFKLPLENSERTLLKFEKKKKTPEKYPRKNAEIKKNNL